MVSKRLVKCSVLGVALGLSLALVSPQAHAGDKATADALFKQGRKLMSEGKIAEACAKFETSLKVDFSAGTLLNIANCHAAQNRTATAYRDFLEAEKALKADGRPGRASQAEEARRRAEALKGRLTHVVIEVRSPVQGLQVDQNHLPVEKSAWGKPLAVDPGNVEVVADAPGYKRWTKTITVVEGKGPYRVQVPLLTKPGGAAAVAPKGGDPKEPGSNERKEGGGVPTGAYVLGGLGVVGLGVGAIFGIVAVGQNSDYDNICPSGATQISEKCQSEGPDLADKRATSGSVATIGIIGGTALLSGALLWWALAPSESGPSQARLVSPKGTYHPKINQFGVDPQSRTLVLGGSF